MNERIIELAKQAGAYWLHGDNINYSVEFQEEDLQKFAELIVKECAKVCRDQGNEYALEFDRENCAAAIEEHFEIS